MAKLKNKVIKDTEDSSMSQDNVNHPGHYTWLKEKAGIEVIDITRHLSFDMGNAIKYILRCGLKECGSVDKAIEDIDKAIWYLNDYKNNFLRAENNNSIKQTNGKTN